MEKINRYCLPKWNFDKTIFAELNQEHVFSSKMINKILFSKRLLVDHVDSLEICLGKILDDKIVCNEKCDVLTVRNVSVLVAGTILQNFATPKSWKLTVLPTLLITGGFGGLYLFKNAVAIRNKMIERELEKLIQSIDDFGSCIKRNITYFNEILAMKAAELVESRQIERAWDCITSAKEVVEILFDATRKLEEQYKLPKEYSELYSPMEELRECDYFKKNVTDYNPKNIKDFYNIYAYVQSQFLLRLGLTICHYLSIPSLRNDLSELHNLIQEHVNEEETHFNNLSIELRRKQQLELAELHNTQTLQNKTGPVAVLKDSSLKLNSCMIAVADQCQQLDGVLQRLNDVETTKKDEGKNLLEVANSMRLIEASLSVCCDDFHRLMLVYNKFLSSKLDNKLSITQVDVPSDSNHDDESILRVEICNENFCDEKRGDDFYAYIFNEKFGEPDTEQSDQNGNNFGDEYEILNFEERVTKKKFRPVLKQLKTRIDPIRQEMLEKERRVLESKGIDLDKIIGKGNGNGSDEEDDEEGSGDEIDRKAQKSSRNSKDNYEEMRNFLIQKPNLNLFRLELPTTNMVEEEILE